MPLEVSLGTGCRTGDANGGETASLVYDGDEPAVHVEGARVKMCARILSKVCEVKLPRFPAILAADILGAGRMARVWRGVAVLRIGVAQEYDDNPYVADAIERPDDEAIQQRKQAGRAGCHLRTADRPTLSRGGVFEITAPTHTTGPLNPPGRGIRSGFGSDIIRPLKILITRSGPSRPPGAASDCRARIGRAQVERDGASARHFLNLALRSRRRRSTGPRTGVEA